GSPRPHHYEFAHGTLPRALWRHPGLFINILFWENAASREESLHTYWELAGEPYPEHEQLPADGLNCQIHLLDQEYQAAVITLPEARAAVEAHMVAIVYRPPRRRLIFWKTKPVLHYFTLELACDRTENRWLNLLCEWTPMGHHNYGEGPPAEVPAFLQAIQQFLDNRPNPVSAYEPPPNQRR
ncbi:MAG: hypothetical protein JSS02_05430, partial [Planctomycetes bacterium]|nr:hypothetical protein [Planctomycetota bacterium]